MSLSVCVLIGACSPVTTDPCWKKNVLYSVDDPEPVVGTSSQTITLNPINVGIDVVPGKAFAVVPEAAAVSGAPVLS